ncbi:hypothetical protein [Clostridium botulinum]|uniref:hypothetical protein n=1 Tax=Clostridium botulinum TaxID=1491 RepID=UPI0019684E5A|nr:hypothetical protein [Clostridium botulinum]
MINITKGICDGCLKEESKTNLTVGHKTIGFCDKCLIEFCSKIKIEIENILKEKLK